MQTFKQPHTLSHPALPPPIITYTHYERTFNSMLRIPVFSLYTYIHSSTFLSPSYSNPLWKTTTRQTSYGRESTSADEISPAGSLAHNDDDDDDDDDESFKLYQRFHVSEFLNFSLSVSLLGVSSLWRHGRVTRDRVVTWLSRAPRGERREVCIGFIHKAGKDVLDFSFNVDGRGNVNIKIQNYKH